MSWMERAACKGSPLDYTQDFIGVKYAKLLREVCEICPVQRECLEYANKEKIHIGMWGGLTVPERTGTARRQKNIINLDPETLRQDFETMTLKAVAEKHKVSQQVIYRHIEENPWIRPKKGKKR